MNNVILLQINKIFKNKADYLKLSDVERFQSEGIYWCIAIINQINSSHNPQDEIDLLFKKFNIERG